MAAETVAWWALGGARDDYRCTLHGRLAFFWLGWVLAGGAP